MQEVILRAMSGEFAWVQAAEILGRSARSMRRWRARYEEHGYNGLYDRRTRRPSPQRVPVATVERVLRLYRERYADFNVRHFHEVLQRDHGVGLSDSWVKKGFCCKVWDHARESVGWTSLRGQSERYCQVQWERGRLGQ